MTNIPPVPPQNNMGGTSPTLERSPSVSIDWFTCTYLAKQIPVHVVETLFIKFCSRYVVKRARFVAQGMRNKFENRRTLILGDEAASFAWGGNMGFAMIEFRGGFCGYLDARAWRLASWFVRRYNARITRCDIAGDFYMGEVKPRQVYAAYENDPSDILDIKGRVPRLGQLDRGQGFSCYIGTKNSPREINIYEKGLQLSRNQFPDWARIEVRYRRDSDKFEIDSRILNPENWWGFIAGLGPYFRKLVPANPLKIGYHKKQLHATANALVLKQIKHVVENYGNFFGFLLEFITADQFAKLLSTEKEWKKLEAFKGWECDDNFKELIFNTLSNLVNPSEHFKHNDDLPDF